MGKTTLALQMIASAVKAGCRVCLIDSELSVEEERARFLGVKTSEVIAFKNTKENLLSLEKAASYIRVLTNPDHLVDKPTLIVLDSIAASGIETEASTERDIKLGNIQPGIRARLLGDLLRSISPRLKPTRTCLLLINQIREKIGVMFGNPLTTPGGHAVRSFASVRLWMTQSTAIKKDGKSIGFIVNLRAEKNKFAVPWQKIPFKFLFASGIDPFWSTVELGIERGLIKKVKNTYHVGGKTFGLKQEQETAAATRGLLWRTS